MDKVTWRHQCFVCKRPIRGGKPCVVFSTDKTELVGLCHSRCSYGLYQYDYGWFQMCPPDYLSEEQLSFLVQFYYRLYNLPGGQEPNRELRICLAQLYSVITRRQWSTQWYLFGRAWTNTSAGHASGYMRAIWRRIFSAFSDISRGRLERCQLKPKLTSGPEIPCSIICSKLHYCLNCYHSEQKLIMRLPKKS